MSTAPHVNTVDEAELFPPVEPWPSPVDPSELLDDIDRTIRRFVVCDPEVSAAVTPWVVLTWVIDWAQVAPLLVISAVEKECGKTQLITVIGRLCRRPLETSSITPAAIYQVIEMFSPTLLIDEADVSIRGNDGFQKILDAGHTRDMGRVIRRGSKGQGLEFFRTWGAKAIAGIGVFLPEPTLGRSIRVELRRKRPDEKAERLRYADPVLFDQLRRKLARLAQDAGETIGKNRPELPAELGDRAGDNWEPLLAIADYAGGHWPETARAAARLLSGASHEVLSLSVELLSDIRDIFERRGGDWIRTADLLSVLNADEERPWATLNRGGRMTGRNLGQMLGKYGISSSQKMENHFNSRGYSRNKFEDTFVRYLPAKAPESAAVPPRPDENQGSFQAPGSIGLIPRLPSVPPRLPPQQPAPIPQVPEVSQRAPAVPPPLPLSPSGISSPLASGANPSASPKAAENKESSGIADIWGDDLDDIEL